MNRILRELIVFDDLNKVRNIEAYQLMEVVAKEVCTSIATVPVVNAKERTFRPHAFEMFLLRFHDVQDDGDAVLVVVPANALVRVCAVPCDHAVVLAAELCVLVVGHQAVYNLVGLLGKFLLDC